MEPTILILIMVSVLLAGAWINSEIANYKQRREIEINRRAWSIARPPSYSRDRGASIPVDNSQGNPRQEDSSSGIWLVMFIFLAFLFMMVIGTVSETNTVQNIQKENTEIVYTDFE